MVTEESSLWTSFLVISLQKFQSSLLMINEKWILRFRLSSLSIFKSPVVQEFFVLMLHSKVFFQDLQYTMVLLTYLTVSSQLLVCRPLCNYFFI